MDIHKNRRLLGYVVHLPFTDEFLAEHIADNPDGVEGFIWSKIPDLSLIFKKRKKAISFIEEHKPEAVAGALFDLGTQYMLDLDYGSN
jgi:hypothetical protein